MAKKKIALVNQRYGLEVNGGSEYYTRLIAERLAKDYDVEVLTSKALSYETWANHYKKNKEIINGVKVRRFKVVKERNETAMRLLGKLIAGKAQLNKKFLCDLWVKAQGPQVPGLIDFIRTHKEEYAAIIFVTYLYYPTVVGMPEAKERAIFIPTAHDEPYIHFQSHAPLFTMPRAVIYLTDEEKALVNKLYHNEDIPSIVAGVGVDVPEKVDNTAFREKYDIKGDYLIYTGRVDASKGCDRMFEYFQKYLKGKTGAEDGQGRSQARNGIASQYASVGDNGDNLTLVVMGQQFMDIPEDEHIRYLGFVSEEDKFGGVAGAKALWLPSPFESLSISVLEAMALNVPVLVNGECEVLRGHCEKSGGGLYYTDYDSCREALERILKDQQCQEEMGRNAGIYIRENYLWEQILNKIKRLIEEVPQSRKA